MTIEYISIIKINMVEEANLEFKLGKIDETRNYILYEIKDNDLKSYKHKTTCKYLNYVGHLLILASTIAGCVSISPFASLVCVPGWYYEFCSRNTNLYNHFRN